MLVPEGRHEITTEGGLDVAGQEARLKTVVKRLADAGIVVSVFIDAELRAGRGRGAHRRARCARSTPARTRMHSTPRAATPKAPAVVAELERIRNGGRRHPRARHALQRRPCAQLLQRAAGGGAAGRARAAHRPRHRVAAVFVGMREAVREMKALMREAAT